MQAHIQMVAKRMHPSRPVCMKDYWILQKVSAKGKDPDETGGSTG